jgi:hypothetical protein
VKGKDHINHSGVRGGRQRKWVGAKRERGGGRGVIGFGNAVRDFQNAVEMRQVKE